jgi:uncharacterized protein (DUF2126 family)/transglutaminase-like putative cysteine protease
MGIQVALNHRTQYRYDRPITLGPQVVRLRPAAHCRTPILSYSLNIIPNKHYIHWQQDQHGNHQARLVFPDKTSEFLVEVDLRVEISPINPFDFFLEPGTEEFPFEYGADLKRDLQLFLTPEAAGPKVSTFISETSREKRGTVSFLMELNGRVRDAVGYVTRFDPGIQTCEETLEKGSGSCRDSTWLLVQVLRQLGFAARFVSGYLIQLASDEEVAAAPLGTSTDSTDLHAWAEVFLPGAGWIGLDPTSGLLTGEGHIPLACTPDAGHAAPISGTVEPANVEFSYSMGVRRLTASAPPSNPISDEQWGRVTHVAHQVDADLAALDVRLTMGGEPTFVGLDEPDSPQWNVAAMGPLKRERAVALIKRLRDRMAPGALLHFGQGKWYPGEPLPRWALNCYWRSDGVAVWENAALIADDNKDYGFERFDALEFIEALARRLEVSTTNILPAYEDAVYFSWRERKLPINVDIADSKLSDSREREELLRVFSSGLGNPAGYVLPIRRRQHEGRIFWSSQLWFLRPRNLFLLQGDSPIGFRLPLDGLPWVAPDDIDYDYEVDPFAEREKLPPRGDGAKHLFAHTPPGDPLPAEPVTGDSAKDVIRPALSVEVRQGRLHVFLPYTTRLADYLDLLIAVEDTAAYLNKPVWIEGYTPPSDPRLRSFSVTPDPGVIEVNLPPAEHWDELVRINTLVFDEAQQVRLTAEKFAYDGKHTATGGGNHIVIGGATAADSPLLRRPDLLRSMVAFWQNHPSLSYLFSGTFIGPTSQYPRVDEARLDSLYELEIAFSELPSGDCPPWMVDRLFRNLLVDMTGNTHRAEFCIDKLYPPQGSGSRLGLLELRAFEMAPHIRMELAKLLLIRALVAIFWKKPYQARLVRWGTALHDRFLLPHFVRQDFLDVLTALQRFGYAFDAAWFQPQIDFRFPKIGSIAVADIQLELRQALEPWHVLGEEASAAGTVRSVDSSLDRVQIKVAGFEPSRFAVVCNGRRVPLHSTGKPGESVAGVRYRAWHPPSCLHPTIPIQTPLVFDILDLWSEQTIGGCAYHVVHPGGRWYNARPANAEEAKGRRAERFQNFGHTPGVVTVPEEELNPSFPMTLDLRWPAANRQNLVGAPVLDA